MVTILKKGSDKETIKNILKKIGEEKPKKGLDAYKFEGQLNFRKMGWPCKNG